MIDLEILFEDNHLLAVNKPAGLLSQGDRSGEPSLVDVATHYLKVRYAKPGNVFVGLLHRLDRPASGVDVAGQDRQGGSPALRAIPRRDYRESLLGDRRRLAKRRLRYLVRRSHQRQPTRTEAAYERPILLSNTIAVGPTLLSDIQAKSLTPVIPDKPPARTRPSNFGYSSAGNAARSSSSDR